MRRTGRDQREHLVDQNRLVDTETLDWAVAEYITALRITRKPRTVEHARQYLRKFVQWCKQQGVQKVKDLNRSHIRNWQVHLLEQYDRRATVWSINCDVRAFLNWCVNEGFLDEPPFRQGDFVPKPKPEPKPLTSDEVCQILHTLEDESGWIAARDRAIIAVLLYTGMRRGELLQMKVGDLDRQPIIVRQKGDRSHAVYLDDETISVILRYLRLYARNTGHRLGKDDALWRSPGNKPLSANGLRLMMERLSKRSGVKVWCHRLRATSATLRLAAGASTAAVREQLGHSDLRSVEHYVRLAESDLQRILYETSPLRWIRSNRQAE